MRVAPASVSVLGLVAGFVLPVGFAPAQGAVPRCDGLKATIVGNAKNNTLTGTPKRDVIVAGAGNDKIRGLGGNDVICGGEGADVIHGGPGDDRLYGEADRYWTDRFGRLRRKGDTLVPGAGDDHVDPGADLRAVTPGASAVPDGVSYASAPQPAVVSLQSPLATVTADGADRIVTNSSGMRFVGTPFDDVITGTDGDDIVSALGGDDVVSGWGGDDVIGVDMAGQPGNDVASGGAGDDTLTGSLGADTFVGNTGDDTMSSSSTMHQMFRGGSGADTVSFPLPAESGFVAKGYGGADTLRLLPHPNPTLKPTLRIDQRRSKATVRSLAPTTLTGKVQGFSRVLLPSHTKSIFFGSNAAEVISAHPDYRALIHGRGGADVLTGSRRPDRLDGGPGFDLVRGMGGNDTCKAAERRWSC